MLGLDGFRLAVFDVVFQVPHFSVVLVDVEIESFYCNRRLFFLRGLVNLLLFHWFLGPATKHYYYFITIFHFKNTPFELTPFKIY